MSCKWGLNEIFRSIFSIFVTGKYYICFNSAKLVWSYVCEVKTRSSPYLIFLSWYQLTPLREYCVLCICTTNNLKQFLTFHSLIVSEQKRNNGWLVKLWINKENWREISRHKGKEKQFASPYMSVYRAILSTHSRPFKPLKRNAKQCTRSFRYIAKEFVEGKYNSLRTKTKWSLCN